jgi:hypothetical protein
VKVGRPVAESLICEDKPRERLKHKAIKILTRILIGWDWISWRGDSPTERLES